MSPEVALTVCCAFSLSRCSERWVGFHEVVAYIDEPGCCSTRQARHVDPEACEKELPYGHEHVRCPRVRPGVRVA